MIETNGSLIRLGLTLGGLVIFLIIELIAPYRPSTVSKAKRWAVNMGLTVFNSFVLFLIFEVAFLGAVIKTANYVNANGLGVLNMLALPGWAKLVLTVVFMDFMLYVWHFLNHEMPLLWRFHRVHHTDLNMDVSTATRFHLGELFISALIKISLIYFLGASLLGVLIFESALQLCTQFHHSCLRISGWFEKIWWVLFVPPSMHRIHHSVVIKERDTNYGTIFSVWDRFLGTMRSDVDQAGIRIGVGGHHYEGKLNLRHLLALPFTPPVR